MDKKEIKQFDNWFKEHFAERDKIDKQHEIDLTLTLEENKTIFTEKFADYYSDNKDDFKAKIKELERQTNEVEYQNKIAHLEHIAQAPLRFVK